MPINAVRRVRGLPISPAGLGLGVAPRGVPSASPHPGACREIEPRVRDAADGPSACLVTGCVDAWAISGGDDPVVIPVTGSARSPESAEDHGVFAFSRVGEKVSPAPSVPLPCASPRSARWRRSGTPAASGLAVLFRAGRTSVSGGLRVWRVGPWGRPWFFDRLCWPLCHGDLQDRSIVTCATSVLAELQVRL